MQNIVAISIMAFGGIALAMLVSIICGKRKLGKHKEYCSKDPHVPGMETNKSLRQEIERRLERVSEIKCEPLLLSLDLPPPKDEQVQYYYRMKALDYISYLEKELSKLPGVTPRQQHESIRGFLLRLTLSSHPCGVVTTASPSPVLRALEPRLLHQLCDLHAHARFHAEPFTKHHLTTTNTIMRKVLHCGRSGGIKSGSDDCLKAPSDHDSAIDTDPVEFDPPEDYDEVEDVILTAPVLSSHRHPQKKYQTEPEMRSDSSSARSDSNRNSGDSVQHFSDNSRQFHPKSDPSLEPSIRGCESMAADSSAARHHSRVGSEHSSSRRDSGGVKEPLHRTDRSRQRKSKSQRPARLTIQDDEIAE